MKNPIVKLLDVLAAAPSEARRDQASIRLQAGAVLFSILALTAPVSQAGSVPAPYEIGTWQGFRSAAISYTFDDNCTNQFWLAVPMFNARGLKLTLFPVINWLPGWTQVQNAALAGHEIGSHTVTHANLGGLSDAQQAVELTNSQNTINANVPGQKCVTLAYPNCVPGTESLISQYYIGARTCSGEVVPSTPADFLQISCFICGNQGTVLTLQNFTNVANNAFNAQGWCVYLIHGIDSDGGYSPLPSSTLQASVDYFSARLDRFWVQTFGNVIRYIKERNAASVVETSSTDDSITLQVTDGLDDSIFNYPITLRRPMPTNWPGVIATQSNAPITALVIPIGLTNYIMVDVVPDGGDVVLTKDPTPTPPAISVTPTNQDFSGVAIGTSIERSFLVQNTGGSTLSGSASVAAPFSVVGGSPYNLASNQSVSVTVRFTPTSAGTANQNVPFTGGGGATGAVSGWGYGYVPTQVSGGRMSNGLFNFTLIGMEGSNYVIIGTSNFLNWWSVSTNVLPAGGSMVVTDPTMTNQRQRFYRAFLQ